MSHVTVIAEVGSVHDGSFGNALRLIDTAKEIGADVVKFQTHLAAAETLRNAPMPPYFKGEPRFEYFERTGFSFERWCEIKKRCDELGIGFLSSPFSSEAVDLLEQVGSDTYKIGSGEVSNIPLLERVAETGKHVIISSGMSSWDELDRAVLTIRQKHNNLSLLQCTSEYPCPPEDVGLNIMLEMKARYGVPIGLSDHTLTQSASLAAVALGGTIIEKHLTFSRRMYGSDARHSLEPAEFQDLIRGIREITSMMSSKVDKDAMAGRLREMKQIFEKSIVSITDIPEGTVLTREHIGVKKPGSGIPARRFAEVLGKRTNRAIPRDTLLSEVDLHA